MFEPEASKKTMPAIGNLAFRKGGSGEVEFVLKRGVAIS
jgi:hypothetical protein